MARLISLGLAWLARAMTLARTAALTKTAATRAVRPDPVHAVEAGGGLDLPRPGERVVREVRRIGRVEQRDARVEQFAGTLDRLDRPAEPVAERDLAAVEPAERDAQSQAIGQEEEVVGGVVVHGAAFLREVRTPLAGPMT